MTAGVTYMRKGGSGTLGRKKRNLTEGMTYLFTFGCSLDIYGKGNYRVGIDRNTGEMDIEYTIAGGEIAPSEGGDAYRKLTFRKTE